MFILVSFAGKISSEESSTYIHPEVERLSGPGCNQEGEERPVSSHSFLGEDGPGVRVPSCLCVKGPVKVSEKSLGDVTKCREKQRDIGKTLRFSQLRKENRCCKEKDHLTHETTCFNNFSFNK